VRLLVFGVALAAVAFGQWSEPVTLASNPAPYGAGPILMPHPSDSTWAFWIRAYRGRYPLSALPSSRSGLGRLGHAGFQPRGQGCQHNR